MNNFKNNLLPYLVCFSGALFFAYELMQLHMMNAIAPFLMKDLQMNATSFGNLCSTYLLADVIFLLPAGIILDRFSIRKVILTALLCCLVGTIGFALSQNILHASLSHFLSGIGNAFCFLSCMMLVAKWFPPKKQALVVGLVITIGMLGGVIAQSPFSKLAELLTWRKALLIDAAFGCMIYGLIFLFVQDAPNEAQDKSGKLKSIPLLTGVKKSLSLQNLSLGLYTALTNLPLMVLGAVFGSLFLTHVHHIPLASASFIISMICMGTIIGSPLYGLLSDRSGSRKPWMLLGAVLSLATMATITYLPSASSPLLTLLFFSLGLFSSSQILSYPIITDTSPKELTGTSMGVAAVVIMGLPMFIAPLMGFLLDRSWDGTLIGEAPLYGKSAYIAAFSPLIIGFFLASFVLLFIREKKAPHSLQDALIT